MHSTFAYIPYLVLIICTHFMSLVSAQAQFTPPVEASDISKLYVNDGHTVYVPYKTYSTQMVPVPSLTYAVPPKTPIKSIGYGTVRVAEFAKDKGWFISIDHGNQIFSEYHHLDTLFCKVRQKVSPESIIGLSGLSGRATGPHLDLIVTQNGQEIDPRKLLLYDCCMLAPLSSAQLHRFNPDSSIFSIRFDSALTGAVMDQYYTLTNSTDYHVRALADGKVIRIDTAIEQESIFMVIEHQHHLISYYGNLANGCVQLHDSVKVGQSIGQIDSGKNSFLLFMLTGYQTPIYPHPLYLLCP